MKILFTVFFLFSVSHAYTQDSKVLVVPLLERIFFDSCSAAIPDRYVQLTPREAQHFTIKSKPINFDYEVYRNILNVVGQRMTDNPSWRLKLMPISHGEDTTKELLNARMNNIVQYLNRVWGVDTNRFMKVATKRSQTRYNWRMPPGAKANWGIDLIPSNIDLLAPIVVRGSSSLYSTALRCPLMLWPFDTYKVSPRVLQYVDTVNAYRSDSLTGRFVIHFDTLSGYVFCGIWEFYESRTRAIEKRLAVDSTEGERSPHDDCSHNYPEACIYKRAIWVEYWYKE